MRNNKKTVSIMMTVMLTMFVLFNGIQTNAYTTKITQQAQISITAKYVAAAEKYVKPSVFTVKWAQISVYSAQKQVKLVANKNTRTLFNNRLKNVQAKINTRAKVLAALKKAEQANLEKMKTAAIKVASLEAAAKSLSAAEDVTKVEGLIASINTEVANLTNGTTKTSLVNKIKAVESIVLNTKTTIAAKSEAQKQAIVLSELITATQSLVDGATEGTQEGNYKIGAKNDLQAAITAAKEIANNSANITTIEMQNAVLALNNAIGTFKDELIVLHDLSSLKDTIEAAQSLYDGAIEGTLDGNYAVGSKEILKTAIAAAGDIISNSQAISQVEIDNAAVTLKTAIGVFNGGLVATHDTTALSDAIAKAQNIYDGAIEGIAEGNYALGSKDVLKAAITAAKDVAANGQTTSQSAINKASTLLNAAIDDFNNGIVLATHDTTALSDTITKAQNIYDSAIEGTADGNYAAGSKDILKASITTAQDILTNGQMTSQSEIDNAVVALSTAIDTFTIGIVTTHDISALSDAIRTAQNLYNGAIEGQAIGNYAEGSKDKLQAAISEAQTTADNGLMTSQSDINKATDLLNSAIQVFNSNVIL